ncbi:hypothetical protein X801_04879 [Opisthorchis viverrini]|uniref:Uncharacterized protein n=1 Tax=Opisthorchis viverrini TaxID=6198 RepID=A0A1S8WY17_OPIVI|nr:hypothetical protein X801_04879 [Opisthorchis viverrini]
MSTDSSRRVHVVCRVGQVDQQGPVHLAIQMDQDSLVNLVARSVLDFQADQDPQEVLSNLCVQQVRVYLDGQGLHQFLVGQQTLEVHRPLVLQGHHRAPVLQHPRGLHLVLLVQEFPVVHLDQVVPSRRLDLAVLAGLAHQLNLVDPEVLVRLRDPWGQLLHPPRLVLAVQLVQKFQAVLLYQLVRAYLEDLEFPLNLEDPQGLDVLEHPFCPEI